MSVRRPRKRLVCVQCKATKRRCDKLRPICSRCRRSSLKCSYEENPQSSRVMTDVSPVKTFPINKADTQLTYSFLLGRRMDLQDVRIDPLKIWNPEERLIVIGCTTFLDYPFSAHSLIQCDHYSRALSGSLHGMTLLDLSNHFNRIPVDGTTPRFPGPLSFIEKAIIKSVKHSEMNRFQPPIPGVFYDPCAVDDDSTRDALKIVLAEIEDASMPRKDCAMLLKRFYQKIYPCYPFIDIEHFENDIMKLYGESDEDHWKIKPNSKDVRKQMETLSLLTIFSSISLKNSTLDENQLSSTKANATEAASRLSNLCHKLLCLLDVFRYPSENTFACLLYFYINGFLDPEDPDVMPTPARLLTLRHLTSLAITLGLQYEPSNYKRITDPHVINLRRKLWLGIQSLRFQFILTEGDSDITNQKYMENFLLVTKNSGDLFNNGACFTVEHNSRNLNISRHKYQFHRLLFKLVSSCAPIVGEVQLNRVLENVKRSEEYIFEHFPISNIIENCEEPAYKTLTFSGDTKFDIEGVGKAEVFSMNIIGYTCFLNVWNVLGLYFEKECLVDWEKYEETYHFFMAKSFAVYLELAGMIFDYLDNKFQNSIPREFEYILDKPVCFALLRIWMYQCHILLRLSYKKEMQQKHLESKTIAQDKSEKEKTNALISKLLVCVRNQMSILLELANVKLSGKYSCAFKTIPMFRYILYVTDLGQLTSVTNEFWKRATEEKKVPQYIEQNIFLKWGLNAKSGNSILQFLTNGQTLGSFNGTLLSEIEKLVSSSSFGNISENATSEDHLEEFLNGNEDNILSQLLQNNVDIFWELLGEDFNNSTT
ncbi:related to Regulator of drug sensitivity 1 [Zygosaccharomyces bailii ISA1307]|nr:related to Regulator of drug sensitivity 1 [Zygosaccharomyces bailii ISA1307]